MAKRKTKIERSIEAELQLEAEHLNNQSSTDAKNNDVTEDVITAENVVPDDVEDKKVSYTRRLRKL